MKIKDVVFLIALGVLCVFTSTADAQAVEPVPFARPNVLAFHITSEHLGETMLVEVALPLSYAVTYENRSYPVMYVVDGLLHFPLLLSNNTLLSFGDDSVAPAMIPEIITVGIDFAVEIDQWEQRRLTYFTPTEVVDPDYGAIGGQADRFLDFVRYELKPFIETTFRTDLDQDLFAGHSLGGLLSLYTLFTQADLFEMYIAASPSNYWDDEIIYDFEEAYHASSPEEPETLFMSVGTREDPWGVTLDYVRRLGRQIRHHRYQNLTFRSRVFGGHNHSSVVVHAYERGARFVFGRLPALESVRRHRSQP